MKELNIFAMPFLMPDYKAIDALTQGEVGKEIFKIAEARTRSPWHQGENGFRELSNSKKAIRKPEDLQGPPRFASSSRRCSWRPSRPSAPTRPR